MGKLKTTHLGKYNKAYCPYERGITLLGDRYILSIVRELEEKPLRFNQVLESLKPLSSKTLSIKIKELLKHQIITKIIISTTPMVATYALTEKGKDLLKVIEDIGSWTKRWYA